MTSLFSGCMICVSAYPVQVPPVLLLEPAENSESGQNPERYRHCMRGGAAQDESQSLGVFPRRQCGRLMMRKSGDLLEYAFCVIMEWTVCMSWKIGHGSAALPWLFALIGGLLIAVCEPLLIFFPQNAETFSPVPAPPREPGIKESYRTPSGNGIRIHCRRENRNVPPGWQIIFFHAALR